MYIYILKINDYSLNFYHIPLTSLVNLVKKDVISPTTKPIARPPKLTAKKAANPSPTWRKDMSTKFILASFAGKRRYKLLKDNELCCDKLT